MTAWAFAAAQTLLFIAAAPLLGVFPTTVIEAMAPITQMLVQAALPSAAAQGWMWLTPISPQVASYSAPFVLIAIVAVFGLGYLILKRGAIAPRRAYAWDCGFGQLTHVEIGLLQLHLAGCQC